MNFRIQPILRSVKVVAMCFAVTALLVGEFSGKGFAGDGFPPNGAWAYGSRPFGSSLIHSYGYRSGLGYRHSLHGFYGHRYSHHAYRPRYSSFFSVSSPFVYRSYRYSSPFSHFYHSGFSGSSLTYRTYIPLYATVPVFAVPSCPQPVVTRVVVPPTCCDTNGNYLGASLQVNAARAKSTTVSAGQRYSASKPILSDEYFPASVSENSSVLGYLASVQNETTRTEWSAAEQAAVRQEVGEVPAELLRVADALLKVGGSTEAAQAYARLAVRFGSSDLIYGRRFIAQIMAGDFDQAAVIVESARLAEYQIRRQDLPAGGLSALGIDSAKAAVVGDRLAKAAYEQLEDTARLRTVAYWLSLAGDDSRAKLFFEHADKLDDQEQNDFPLQRPGRALISKR